MAPEVFQEKYCMKADSWSIGCVAYQMATGTPPWKNLGYTNPVSLFNYIQSVEGPPSMVMPDEVNMKSPDDVRRVDLMRKLVIKCFARNPSDRPSAKEMLSDIFFAEGFLWRDADHLDSCNMFSPSALATGASPIKLEISPIRHLSRRKSIGSGHTAFVSPPLPRHVNSKIDFSPVSLSPPPDTSGWPSWAKRRHGLEHSQKTELKEVENLMGSLDVSEGSKDSQAKADESNSILNSDTGSSLQGLYLVDSSKQAH
jgi:serine/threonine protein kinase